MSQRKLLLESHHPRVNESLRLKMLQKTILNLKANPRWRVPLKQRQSKICDDTIKAGETVKSAVSPFFGASEGCFTRKRR